MKEALKMVYDHVGQLDCGYILVGMNENNGIKLGLLDGAGNTVCHVVNDDFIYSGINVNYPKIMIGNSITNKYTFINLKLNTINIIEKPSIKNHSVFFLEKAPYMVFRSHTDKGNELIRLDGTAMKLPFAPNLGYRGSNILEGIEDDLMIVEGSNMHFANADCKHICSIPLKELGGIAIDHFYNTYYVLQKNNLIELLDRQGKTCLKIKNCRNSIHINNIGIFIGIDNKNRLYAVDYKLKNISNKIRVKVISEEEALEIYHSDIGLIAKFTDYMGDIVRLDT